MKEHSSADTSEPLCTSKIRVDSYIQLQSIDILKQARKSFPLSSASIESTNRTIFQSMEIALLNITLLLKKATLAIEQEDFDNATMKMSWIYGFHSIMHRLSQIPHEIGFTFPNTSARSKLSITDSPTYKIYFDTLKYFDEVVKKSIASGLLLAANLLANQTFNNNQLHFLHLVKTCNHYTTIWESYLSDITIPILIPNYETFVDCISLYNAVHDTSLPDDTYYTPFRGLHQIPELLSEEINDYLEKAILNIRHSKFQQAYEQLRFANTLTEGILITLQPIIDNLSPSDYYLIRGSIGSTSGSHSVNLHYHLFRDLYEQLCEEFIGQLTSQTDSVETISQIMVKIDEERFDDPRSFLLSLISSELLKLRIFIRQWRNGHLHLPRNNVGSNARSLAGSTDAIQSSQKMRDSATKRDPIQFLAEVRNINSKFNQTDKISLQAYFQQDTSLDYQLLEITGQNTRGRFVQVQNRTGAFSHKSTFIPPPRKRV